METNKYLQGIENIKNVENLLTELTRKISLEIEPIKYQNYIFQLLFLKRLSDIFEDIIIDLAKNYQKEKNEIEKIIIENKTLIGFYIPENARWKYIANQNMHVNEKLDESIKLILTHNPSLDGAINIVNFTNKSENVRSISNEKMRELILIINKYKLGLNDVDYDLFGFAYEFFIKNFLKGSEKATGEFYTPKSVVKLISNLADPEPGNEIYDPTCGTGGLLIGCQLKFKEKFKNDANIKALKFYGQEIQQLTSAIAKVNMLCFNMNGEIKQGDTLKYPAFINQDGSLKKFDIIVANPMWNQKIENDIYQNDRYGRFILGYPPTTSADLGWIQHILASLKENGKGFIILDSGVLSRGSENKANHKEKDIREKLVEMDFIEAIILLPENVFYNTTAGSVIIVINKTKTTDKKNKILFIDASQLYETKNKKNYITDDGITQITEIFKNWKETEGVSKIITKLEISKKDYNLMPTIYIQKKLDDDTLPLDEALALYIRAVKEAQEAEENLLNIFKELNLKIDID